MSGRQTASAPPLQGKEVGQYVSRKNSFTADQH